MTDLTLYVNREFVSVNNYRYANEVLFAFTFFLMKRSKISYRDFSVCVTAEI